MRLYRWVDMGGMEGKSGKRAFRTLCPIPACHPGYQVMYLSDIFEIVARG